MQLNHLVVLDGEVVPRSLEVCHLHKEARHKRLAYVDVVVFAGELCRCTPKVEAVHDPRELLSDVVGTLHGSIVDKIVIAPLCVLVVLLEGMVHVEQSQVVTVYVGEAHLGLVRRLLGLVGAYKTLRN